ncbi:MAG: hypothetical protein LBR34_06735 [Prevotella sp.]|jgi:hypothetical protein|nr:hypothetical protein [Prevotella sp.]
MTTNNFATLLCLKTRGLNHKLHKITHSPPQIYEIILKQALVCGYFLLLTTNLFPVAGWYLRVRFVSPHTRPLSIPARGENSPLFRRNFPLAPVYNRRVTKLGLQPAKKKKFKWIFIENTNEDYIFAN